MTGVDLPRVYCWVNSGMGTDFQLVVGMAEDGTPLASHLSSCKEWAQHDIGADGRSKWKHEAYRAHYPDGFEVVWVDDFHARRNEDARFVAAIERNQEMGRKAAAAGVS